MIGQLSLAVDTLPTNRREGLSQWFTDPRVAKRVVRWCGSPPCERILEPTAGSGVFVHELREQWSQAEIVACELDPEWAAHLRDTTDATVVEGDYLAAPPPAELYDLCAMNPPYEGGQDVEFVAKAMSESVRVVAVLRSAVLHLHSAHERIFQARGWGVVSVAHAVGRWRFDGPVDGTARQDFCAVKLSRLYRGSTQMEFWA